jgi:hypothetical protein
MKKTKCKEMQIFLILVIFCIIIRMVRTMQCTAIQNVFGMRSSRVVRAYDSQCRSRYCLGFDPSILRHSRIQRAADEAVVKKVLKKFQKYPPLKEFVYIHFILGICFSTPGPMQIVLVIT